MRLYVLELILWFDTKQEKYFSLKEKYKPK